MSPVDSLPAAPRGPVSREAARIAASLRAPAPRYEPARLEAARADIPRADLPTVHISPADAPVMARLPAGAPRVEIMAFALGGLRLAFPAAQVMDSMTASGARWARLLAMADTGTLASSGLPLIELAARMGVTTPRAAKGTLLLVGSGGKVRAAVLVEGELERHNAVVDALPPGWRDRFGPGAHMLEGVARLADGARVAMVDLPLGVAMKRPAPEADTAHLLVRAGRAQMEAVRVATLQSVTALEKVPGIALLPTPGRPTRRMLLAFGGEGEAVVVDEIVGLAPQGRIERVGGLRFLATASGRYRLLEPAGTQAPRPGPLRVLVTAPEGEARTALRDLVRSMGHEVRLADDPRAVRLMGGRFDLILFDLDAYAGVREVGVASQDSGRRIGLATAPLSPPPGFDAVVKAGDKVALVLALLAPATR
ncbi:chemotaxis protein CheW [Ancylobacter vacuolatus]|uniref:CheY-like chemotaxis protein n=1 Tax=Ancylobacter vacuolatus TaxID=223389 RepID=A0ABU0DIG9_9HYPH|nr:chemotaxis protein CheW [Ancylobacter vacuolatus]MDQ0348189.1 CheY-like chemotaxis protein [Ancylobacter vacuolatus]